MQIDPLETVDLTPEVEAMPKLTLSIGIGTGGTGQYVGQDADGNWWVVDLNAGQKIKLAYPGALVAVLGERLIRGAKWGTDD